MAQTGFMRTIEETRAHIKALHDEIENGDVGARHNGPNCPGCLYSILAFIDSEPPCTHRRCVYYPLAAGGFAWFVLGNVAGCDPIKFCPDCGEELPAEGLA